MVNIIAGVVAGRGPVGGSWGDGNTVVQVSL